MNDEDLINALRGSRPVELGTVATRRLLRLTQRRNQHRQFIAPFVAGAAAVLSGVLVHAPVSDYGEIVPAKLPTVQLYRDALSHGEESLMAALDRDGSVYHIRRHPVGGNP